MTQNMANKGKAFEELVEYACQAYVEGQALIQKIATPTKVIRRYDPTNNKSKIVSAFHEKHSTVDFVGTMHGGRAVAFDAKSTMNSNQFNLSMIEPHQEAFLYEHAKMGGISFLLVESTANKQVYRLMLDELLRFRNENERKSIPWRWFKENCHIVQGMPLHFLGGLL
jgi:recombination protein U